MGAKKKHGYRHELSGAKLQALDPKSPYPETLDRSGPQPAVVSAQPHPARAYRRLYGRENRKQRGGRGTVSAFMPSASNTPYRRPEEE